jgi:hypothetical protein
MKAILPAVALFDLAAAQVAAAPSCDGYTVSNAGNASLNGCYKSAGQLFGAPRFVKDSYSELFRYCGAGCPMSTEAWRIGLPVADSPSCSSLNASCWTLKRAFYTMPCVVEWPSHDGWISWGYAHNLSKPLLQGPKLSPSCAGPGPAPAPGPGPAPGTPGTQCGYTARAELAGHPSSEFASDVPVPWGTKCNCVDVPGTTACAAVDMAQESSPKQCTPDLRSIPADLTRPPMRTDLIEPVAGSRTKQTHPDFAHTAAYHALYLPPQWKKGSGVKLPVLVEYSGNGPWAGSPGVGDGHWADKDVSTGRPEDQNMGYGISGGQGFIWVSMPLLTADLESHTNISTFWWGCNNTMAFAKGACGTYDLTPTLEYTKKTVASVLAEYGGDPDNVYAMGWSRGAIAAGYIALHDDEIAKIWKGFIPFSHIDGMIEWGYPGSGVDDAKVRYRRAAGKHIFVTAECDVATNCQHEFLKQSGILAPNFTTPAVNFTFVNSGFRNHNDMWLLRPSVARIRLRRWLRDVMSLPAQLPECTAGVLPPFCFCTLRCPGDCCAAVGSSSNASSKPPVCSRQTMFDDFSGTELNTSIWTKLDQIHRGGLYHPDNVEVRDGKLWMKTAPANRTMADQLWFMSSGAVNTSNRFQQKYGVFEVTAMPYYCPSHVKENASKEFAFISHNTFWMYGFVEQPVGAQAKTCNCPEEFDVWEMGAQNWHLTGDERQNQYTNVSKYCETCTGPFAATAITATTTATATTVAAAVVTPAGAATAVGDVPGACPGGYIVSGGGASELDGCYSPLATKYKGTVRYGLKGTSGVYTNASLFRYPAQPDMNPEHWPWRLGTLNDDGLLGQAFYTSPCATPSPMKYGWTRWGNCPDPPPLLQAGAGVAALSTTCPPPTGAPPGSGDCSQLKMQVFTLEWREHVARVFVDGQLMSEFSTATYADELDFNYFGKYNDEIIYGGKGPGSTAIDWVQQPLFLSFTSCIMNNVPLATGGHVDGSPMYFVVDSVRVCE